MNRVVAAGALLVAGTIGTGWAIWGSEALVATSASASLAWLVHVVAASRLRRTLAAEPEGLAGANLKGLAGAFVFGMGLRLLGVAVVTAAVLTERTWFPTAPSLLSYGAVLVPLLFMELRFLK